MLFRVHFVHLVHWVHLKICQAAGNFKREINKSFCHKPSKNQKMVGGGGDRREACVSIGARRGGEKRKATQSKITAAALRGQSLALCLCRLVAKHIYQFATKAVSAFEKPTVFQKPCRGRRGSTRSVREHRSTNVREAQGNHTVKNHRGHEQ